MQIIPVGHCIAAIPPQNILGATQMPGMSHAIPHPPRRGSSTQMVPFGHSSGVGRKPPQGGYFGGSLAAGGVPPCGELAGGGVVGCGGILRMTVPLIIGTFLVRRTGASVKEGLTADCVVRCDCPAAGDVVCCGGLAPGDVVCCGGLAGDVVRCGSLPTAGTVFCFGGGSGVLVRMSASRSLVRRALACLGGCWQVPTQGVRRTEPNLPPNSQTGSAKRQTSGGLHCLVNKSHGVPDVVRGGGMPPTGVCRGGLAGEGVAGCAGLVRMVVSRLGGSWQVPVLSCLSLTSWRASVNLHTRGGWHCTPTPHSAPIVDPCGGLACGSDVGRSVVADDCVGRCAGFLLVVVARLGGNLQVPILPRLGSRKPPVKSQTRGE